MAGRPPKLTPALQARIVNMISGGCYPEVSAGACDVPRSTFFEWMQRGLGQHPTRKPTAALAAFAHAVTTAVDRSECRMVLRLAEYEEGTRPSKRSPDRRVKTRITMSAAIATQWKLSRRFPERWGQRPALAMNVGVAPTADEAEQDTRPIINVIVAKVDDDGETVGYRSVRDFPELAAKYERHPDNVHPCPEELGADMARAQGR